MTKQFDLFQSYKQCFTTVYKFYSKQLAGQDVVLEDYIKVIQYLEKQCKNRGELDTIRLIKQLRLIVFKSTASEGIPVIPFFKTDNDGLPFVFGQRINKSLKAKNKWTIRMVLTCLQVSYLLKATKEPSLESVTAPSTLNAETLADFDKWCKENCKHILKVKPRSYWNNPHVSTKAGPLGPAVWSAPNELPLLSQDLIKDLKKLGGYKFGEWLNNCYETSDYLIRSQDYIFQGDIPKKEITRKTLRRLTYVKSPEGKARVIAIFDYWSQTVLKEIHNWSFDQLRLIKNDLTFNQGGFKEVLPKVGPYYSFDLKSATDRFPALLQRNVLAQLLDEERADAWLNILTGYSFQCDWSTAEIKYAAGQPMGAYSSWGIFTLCHHLVVRYCAKLVNYSDFTSYCILGDDIVIADSKVAAKYKEVMSLLGVEIDPAKSLVSLDTYEFAKRLIHDNEEITAFPLSAMIDNSKSISALWSVTIVSRERGYTLESPSIPGFIAKIQKSCGTSQRSSYKKCKDLEAYRVLQHGPGHDWEVWALRHMHSTMDRPLSCNDSISTCRSKLLYDLGYFVMKYKALLLENQYQKFQKLTFRLTGETFGKGGIESMGSQAHAPIDLMRIPLVWIAKISLNNQQREAATLKDLLAVEAWDALLRLRVSPVGDLNRVVSRQTNLVSTARQERFIRFLQTEQANLNGLFKQYLDN